MNQCNGLHAHPNLNPLDFYLWIPLKEMDYAEYIPNAHFLNVLDACGSILTGATAHENVV